jgi:hypothetical protein
MTADAALARVLDARRQAALQRPNHRQTATAVYQPIIEEGARLQSTTFERLWHVHSVQVLSDLRALGAIPADVEAVNGVSVAEGVRQHMDAGARAAGTTAAAYLRTLYDPGIGRGHHVNDMAQERVICSLKPWLCLAVERLAVLELAPVPARV